MKTLLSLVSLFGLVMAPAVRAADAPKPDARAEVIFLEPEKFTDVKDSLVDSEQGRDAILAELKGYIIDQAKRFIPPGQKLTVTITDIDMAGEFEPGRNPRLDEVRIIRDIYPPKIDLTFKLADADGKDLAQGTRHLTDLMFMDKLLVNPNDHLRYEKALLDDWLRADFKPLK